MTKVCFKCHVEKPLDEFYRHSQMADGHLSKCAACAKYDVVMARRTNPEKVRSYDRLRARLPHRRALMIKMTARQRAEHPEHIAAQGAAQRAVDAGALVQPEMCEGCGVKFDQLDKHHGDYSKPLAVVWLCKPCHAIADKVRRRLERLENAS